jgi:hypothetical protein
MCSREAAVSELIRPALILDKTPAPLALIGVVRIAGVFGDRAGVDVAENKYASILLGAVRIGGG